MAGWALWIELAVPQYLSANSEARTWPPVRIAGARTDGEMMSERALESCPVSSELSQDLRRQRQPVKKREKRGQCVYGARLYCALCLEF